MTCISHVYSFLCFVFYSCRIKIIPFLNLEACILMMRRSLGQHLGCSSRNPAVYVQLWPRRVIRVGEAAGEMAAWQSALGSPQLQLARVNRACRQPISTPSDTLLSPCVTFC